MTEAPLLAARGLTRHYGRLRALDGVDLTLARGEVLGFLGLNGAGKSTTLQILAGALASDTGTVEIAGASLTREPLRAKAALGYLPETPPLVPDMLVGEYLAWCARLRGVPAAAVAGAVAAAAARCGLADHLPRLIAHLSKGYRQRVGIAQAIVHDPALVLLDEPTSGLDPRQIREVRTLVGELARDRALIVSTHILGEVRLLASRVVILHEGRIVYDAPTEAAAASLRVCLRRAPAVPSLEAIAGVTAARPGTGGTFMLEVDDCTVAAEAVAAAAVANDWGLLELVPDADPLEHVFMRLTSGADTTRAAGEAAA